MYLQALYQQASWFYQLMAAWGINLNLGMQAMTGMAPLFQIGWKTNKIVVSCFIKTSQFIHRYVSIYIYRGYHVVLCYLTLHSIYIYYITLIMLYM